MRIFITGATGLVGRALTLRLRRDGHTVVAWSRSAARVSQRLGGEAEAASGDTDAMQTALDGCDAVVALAGEPVLPGRWTRRKKRALRTSRVDLNETLVQCILQAAHPPRTIVAASAVGFYGNTGKQSVDEGSPPGEGFLADLCQDWEHAFAPAIEAGVRVVHGRIGIVLSRDGGALQKLLPLTRLGLGGPVGHGQQGFPWVHIDDLVDALVFSLTHDEVFGPVNLVAPETPSQRDFAAALGAAVGKTARTPAPAFAMRLLLGDAATALLEGQYVIPRALQTWGFPFQYVQLDDALNDILRRDSAVITPVAPPVRVRAGSDWIQAHPPTHELVASRIVPAPIERVWAFFQDARNLAALSPSDAGLTIDPALLTMSEGARFTHQMRLGPVALPWEGEIVSWQPGRQFVDVQRRGPFGTWWHAHSFHPVALEDGTAATRVHDHVLFASPLGRIGRIATWLFVRRQLLDLFAFRNSSLRLRFGEAAIPSHTATGEAA
ncbi:MAG: TIGR01777 family protein [Deltaproteobacteria bacterium]|nr:TIGR01777 family protein [Deltaproteobacteria bacterium]